MKKQNVPNMQGGYVLVTVMVAAFLVAGFAYLLSQSSATGARMAAADLERDAARYVAEAGLQHGLWLAQQSDCSSYTSLVGEPFGAHSYTVTPTPADGSPIVLQSSALLSSGTGLTLTSAPTTVFSTSSSSTLVLQPGTAGTDTYIRDGANDSNNFGASNILKINNMSAEEAALLKFDLSAIPAGAKIHSATLELWLRNAQGLNNGVVDAHRVTQAWVEGNYSGSSPIPGTGATYNSYNGQTNWANAGGDYASPPIDTATIPGFAADWYAWDLSTVVRDWVAGVYPNEGVLLRASAGVVDKIEFASGDGSPSQHPRLTVTYACECGQTCEVATENQPLVLSTDGDATLGGMTFANNDLVEYVAATDSAALYFDGDAEGLTTKIDALHVLPNGHLVLSTDADTILGGLKFRSEDLIEYDPESNIASMYLEAAAHFSSPKNIRSLHILGNGNIVFSTESSATLAGLDFSDRDLVEYNIDTRQASLFFDGDAVGLGKKIYALHVLDSGNLVLALDGDTTFGGLTVSPGQLIEYDLANDTATMYFDGDASFSTTSEKVLSAYIEDGSPTPALPPPENLLFVVGTVGGPGLSDEELAHQAFIEFWGYEVEIIDDDATQAEFDAAVAQNDVVFTTNDITASRLDTKIVDATIGVVTSEVNLSDEFGLASTVGWDSGTEVEINDNSHYITSPFPTGILTILATNESLAYVSGTESPELGKLASSSSGFGIVTLNAGAAMVGGGNAAGRRVQLPWGGSGFDPYHLNPDGRTILRRAIEWGAGMGGTVLEIQVNDGNDDAEQLISSGYMYLDSSDLELVMATEPTDLVGIRFAGVAIPQAATVSNAYIQFQVDETTSGATSLTIEGEATDDALPFTTSAFNISSRPRTATSASWAPPEWATVGEAGPDQRTVDISSVIQEIINRPGWTSGNALVIIVSGSGVRIAESYEGDPAGAAKLHVEYGDGAPQAPVAGLLAHWKLDETAGSTAVDSIGNNDGQVNGGAIWTTGTIDGGLAVDYTNGEDYIIVPNSAALENVQEGEYTLTAWFRPDSTPPGTSGDNDANYGILIKPGWHTGIFFTNQNRFGFWQHLDGDINIASTSGNTFSPGSFYHVVATVDRAAGLQSLYVNGQLEDTSGFTPGAIARDYGTDTWRIGIANPSVSNWGWAADGAIDDVRIYDRALSLSEVADLYAAGGGGGGGGDPKSGTFRDEFNTKDSYAGSDGTLNWATDWIEINESDGAGSGDEQLIDDIHKYQLRVRDNDGGGEGVQREADLTGCSTASLSFVYRRDSFDDSDDYVTVDVSANGGSSWTELDRLQGPGDETSYQSTSYSISGHIGANTRIRFLSSPNLGGTDELYVDDVEITCGP